MKGILPALGWCVVAMFGMLICLTVAMFVLFEAWGTGSFLFTVKTAALPFVVALTLIAVALANGATLRRRLYYGRGGHKAQRRYRFELCEPIVVSLGPIHASGPGLVQIHLASDRLIEVVRQNTPSFQVHVVGLGPRDIPPAFSELLDGEIFSVYSLSSDSCLIDIPIVCKRTWEAVIELSWIEGMPRHTLTGTISGGRKALRMDVILSGRFSEITLPDDLLITPHPNVPIHGFEVVFPKDAARPSKQNSG